MNRSIDQLIKEGHQAIKRGKKSEARLLLQEAAEKNPADFRAWLGLAAVARTPRESLVFIDRAAELRPDNSAVQKARIWAEGQAAKQLQRQSQIEAQPPPTGLPVREKLIEERPEPQTEPVQMKTSQEPDRSRKFALLGRAARRVVSVAILLGLIIAMGFVFWFAYTTWSESTDLMERDGLPEMSPTSAAVALVPDAQVNNILPPEETDVATPVVETATPNPLQPKNIVQSDSVPRARWTATPEPTLTPTPSPTWVPTFVRPVSEANILKPVGLLPNERWIDVDLSEQYLVALEGDTPVFETLVSTGLPNYPTVTGQFRIWLRYPSQTMDGTRLGYDYYLEGVPYVQYFFEDYALHGTYWHNNFGNPMSHGCVNLSTPDAEWLYNFADYGTVVNVHE